MCEFMAGAPRGFGATNSKQTSATEQSLAATTAQRLQNVISFLDQLFREDLLLEQGHLLIFHHQGLVLIHFNLHIASFTRVKW